MKKILLMTLLFGGTIAAGAQETGSRQKTITVSGSARMEIVPDEIYVQVALREYVKKNGAKTTINDICRQFLEACTGMALPDSSIRVESYQGWDGNNWWYRKNQQKYPDLKAGITYQVKLKNTRQMDELVQRLDDAATQHFSIARVSHSRLEAYKKQVEILALQAAKEKAVYLTAALGATLGEAITISNPEEENQQPLIGYANRELNKAMAGGDTPEPMNVDFKNITLRFNATVVFALQ